MRAKLYTKMGCGYCVKAKTQLSVRGIEFEEINIELLPEAKEEMLTECAKINVVPRTVPQIWLDGNYIGGYDQLKAFLVMNPVENS